VGALALVTGTVGLGIFVASILLLAYYLYTLDYREAVGGSETAAQLTNLALFLLWGLHHRGRRHKDRHPRKPAHEDLRPFFHHQTDRERDGSGINGAQ